MGGVLEITARPPATWLPQGWLFDAALRSLACSVAEENPELARDLADAEIESGGGYRDLRNLPAEQFIPLVHAAKEAVDHALEQGPARGAERSAYLRLVYGLSLLHALLQADPRNNGFNKSDERRILLDRQEAWHAPAAVYDLGVEHLAAPVRLHSLELASELAAARTSFGAGDLDLSHLTKEQLAWTAPAAEWMQARYAPHAALEANAVSFFSRIHPPLARLAESINRAVLRRRG